MTLSLTSQEKRVLGFILLMVCLGLAVLALRKGRPPAPSGSGRVDKSNPHPLNRQDATPWPAGRGVNEASGNTK